ncbi:hypothetical protein VTN31DRAFT_1626 [Thermomyces dupontii]|uniref:uncharacterized protein n=1 Tax=Talaromyces thermophilus TaxID=28565 RepID=UPI0037436889
MEVGEVSYTLANEEEFWNELRNIVSNPGESYEGIDNALREFLGFAVRYKDDILCTADDLTRCSYQLCTSPLFTHHADYVRRQIIHSLLQEDDGDTLRLIASFLLVDGRRHEDTFFLMNEEGCFPRLLHLVQLAGRHRRVVMELLYEMARIQRVKLEDLGREGCAANLRGGGDRGISFYANRLG